MMRLRSLDDSSRMGSRAGPNRSVSAYCFSCLAGGSTGCSESACGSEWCSFDIKTSMNEMAALAKGYTNRSSRTQARDGGRALPGPPQGSNVTYSTDVGTSKCDHSIGSVLVRNGRRGQL